MEGWRSEGKGHVTEGWRSEGKGHVTEGWRSEGKGRVMEGFTIGPVIFCLLWIWLVVWTCVCVSVPSCIAS